MLAVGVERGEVDVERVAVGAAEIDRPLLPVVPDHELAPLVRRGEHDDQRRDHPVELLAVAVGQEEAPRLVEQQVVEVASQLLLLQARARPGPCRRSPRGTRSQSGFVSENRSGSSRQTRRTLGSTRVFVALAVGGLIAVLVQLLRLPGGEGQADRAQPLDLQPGQHGRGTAADAERAGPIDLTQGIAELFQDRDRHPFLLAGVRGLVAGR